MLGKIIAIEGNIVSVELEIDLTKFQSLLNLHVVMQEPTRTIIGEIIDINSKIAGFKDIHEGIITKKSSKVAAWVVPTNEELMIARETEKILKK